MVLDGFFSNRIKLRGSLNFFAYHRRLRISFFLCNAHSLCHFTPAQSFFFAGRQDKSNLTARKCNVKCENISRGFSNVNPYENQRAFFTSNEDRWRHETLTDVSTDIRNTALLCIRVEFTFLSIDVAVSSDSVSFWETRRFSRGEWNGALSIDSSSLSLFLL